MKLKRSAPVILLIVLALIALALKRCNQPGARSNTTTVSNNKNDGAQTPSNNQQAVPFDRNTTNLYFTKHAKCRMKCRQISQQEVRDILLHGKVNYNKSKLTDPRGPTYAIEGITNDRQYVRIIFAPKQTHLTVVTVIDIDVEHQCNCD